MSKIAALGSVDLPTRTALLSVDGRLTAEEVARAAGDTSLAATIAALSTSVDGRIRRGLEAAKATSDTLYWATDTKRLWLYDGTGWIILAEPNQSYTPSLTVLTLNNGTITGSYHRSDGYCDFSVRITFGSTTTMGTAPTISVPVSMLNGQELEDTQVLYYDNTGPRYIGTTYYNSTTSFGLLYPTLAAFGPVSAGAVTATLPFTWAVNDFIVVSGRYRMTSRYT